MLVFRLIINILKIKLFLLSIGKFFIFLIIFYFIFCESLEVLTYIQRALRRQGKKPFLSALYTKYILQNVFIISMVWCVFANLYLIKFHFLCQSRLPFSKKKKKKLLHALLAFFERLHGLTLSVLSLFTLTVLCGFNY